MITDAQVSYVFDDGMLDGLQLLFQINNLTNEPYDRLLREQAARSRTTRSTARSTCSA